MVARSSSGPCSDHRPGPKRSGEPGTPTPNQTLPGSQPMETEMLKPISAALALAALSLAPAPAAAAAAPQGQTVRYDDLDLARPADVERLERRIDQAARSVCGYGVERTGLGEFARSRACFATTRAQARRQVAVLDDYDRLGG